LIEFLLICTKICSQIPREVTLYVKSETDSQTIEGAIVEIRGYGGTETDPSGRVFFPDVPEGDYIIEVRARGYKPYISINPYRITHINNNFSINLSPLPFDTFLIRGRITDSENMRLDSVKVRLITGARKETVITDDWGYYEFKFDRSDIEQNPEYTIFYEKKGYEILKEFKGIFFRDFIDLPNVKMKKIIEKENESNDNSIKHPFLSLAVSPESNLFYDLDQIQINGNLGFFIRWSIKNKKNFTLGIGWHLPIKLTAENKFQTLIGMISSIKTEYKLINYGILNCRLHNNLPNNNSLSYFFDGSILFTKQDPITSTNILNNHEISRKSFYKFIPRLTSGISLSKKSFKIEPYLSLAYLNLKSQNFIFNYFGRADYQIISKNYFQIGLGISLNLTILNY
jgi:hypothetical protein